MAHSYNMNQLAGLILEAYRFTDASHEKIFGAAPPTIQIKPLGRDISGIPIVFQGNQNTCVSCSVTWVRQWMRKDQKQDMERLSWPFLAEISHTGPGGASPSQVLEPARKIGICQWNSYTPPESVSSVPVAETTANRIPGYSFVTDFSPQGLYAALSRGPLAICVMNFQGVGPHCLVAYDVTLDGTALLCANWWSENAQSVAEVQFRDVEVAISFAETPFGLDKEFHAIPFLEVLFDILISFFKYLS